MVKWLVECLWIADAGINPVVEGLLWKRSERRPEIRERNRADYVARPVLNVNAEVVYGHQVVRSNRPVSVRHLRLADVGERLKTCGECRGIRHGTQRLT